MPPSGFNKKAIRGLLEFVEGCYEDLLLKLRDDPKAKVEDAIQDELAEIRRALEEFSLKNVGQ